MEEHLQALLVGGVSFKVAWGTLGSESSLPRAVLYRVSGVRDMRMSGKGLMQGRVQVDCYGATYAQAIGASRDVRGILEGYRGGPVRGMFLQAVRDGFEGDISILQRVSLTFSVTYRD